jgi:hypothetical protein
MRTDLEDLDMIIHRRNGRYLAKIPQVGLYATADSLPKAIEVLEAKKKNLLEELIAADALNEIRILPSSSAAQIKILPALALFAAKAAIVLALALFAGGVARHIVQRDFERGLDQLHQSTVLGGRQFWAQLEKGIENAAAPTSDIPVARRQKLLADLHVIVDRWRPFVREAGRLFSDRDETPPGNP